MRLTINTSAASDWVLSKDGEKLYYLTSFEKGNDLWVTEVRTRETKLFNKLGANTASMELSPDGKFLFVVGDGKADQGRRRERKVRADRRSTRKWSSIIRPRRRTSSTTAGVSSKRSWCSPTSRTSIGTPTTRIYKKIPPAHQQQLRLRRDAERDARRDERLAHRLLYRPNVSDSDATASLGLLYDYGYTGDGESRRGARGRPGRSGRLTIKPGTSSKPSTATRSTPRWTSTSCSIERPASLRSWPSTIPRRTSVGTKPSSRSTVATEGELLYKRWVRARRADVEKLSGGKIGYVHVRANERREHARRLRGVARTESAEGCHRRRHAIQRRRQHPRAVVRLPERQEVFDVVPHGQYVGSQPFDKWIKPSIVVMGESNYSDRTFPAGLQGQELGLLVGMPVPGTGTFVWWENQIDPTLRFGIPMGCWRTPGRQVRREQPDGAGLVSPTNPRS